MATHPTNLTMHREGPSVWDLQHRANSQRRKMGITGFLMIAAGIGFVAQAYKAEWSTDGRGRDNVNKASDASFPASDPPSWTPAVGSPAKDEPQRW
jgi:hypothetical protein